MPKQLLGLVACCLSVAVLGTCRSQKADQQPTISSPSAEAPAGSVDQLVQARPSEPAEPDKGAVDSAPTLAALATPGYREAAVYVPGGPKTPRPVVVAVHGMYDRVEPFCEAWGQITTGWGFVLCPRGLPRVDAGPAADRWTFGWNGRDLEREIKAGLKALKHNYGDRIAEGPVIYVGFSLGAILGADVVLWNPARFTRAVLVEGGTTNWSLATAKTFSRGGGRKLLFACGQEVCVKETRAGLYWLEVAGADAKTAFGGHLGHTYEGVVGEEIRRQWPWLTEGDPRWPSSGDLTPGPLAKAK